MTPDEISAFIVAVIVALYIQRSHIAAVIKAIKKALR
jgi:hypothetical protein